MDPKTATGLTLMDVAVLADGQGNIPDDTAARLAPFFRRDPRVQNELERLRQMSADAGARFLADGAEAAAIVSRLRAGPWESVADAHDPRLDTPYAELLAMTRALAERAAGEERAGLLELFERLSLDLREKLVAESFTGRLIERLLEVEEDVAEKALEHLVRHYRSRRARGPGPPEQPGATGEGQE